MAPKGTLEVPDPPLVTPSLDNRDLCYSYAIGRGEMGVLTFEPYKSLILPFWAFRTVLIAQSSAEVLWAIFISYCDRGDFVGSDVTRKFIQMGMTRSKRYANHKGTDSPYNPLWGAKGADPSCQGGRKYGSDGKVLEKWTGDDSEGKRREKEEASEIFKGYWRRCTSHEKYLRLKGEWIKAKKEYQKTKPATAKAIS